MLIIRSREIAAVWQESDQMTGRHRLVSEGKASDWVEYEAVCLLEKDNLLYMGTTDFWKGKLPAICYAAQWTTHAATVTLDAGDLRRTG